MLVWVHAVLYYDDFMIGTFVHSPRYSYSCLEANLFLSDNFHRIVPGHHYELMMVMGLNLPTPTPNTNTNTNAKNQQ